MEVLVWVRSQRVLQTILGRLDLTWKVQGAFEGLEMEGWAPLDLHFIKTALVVG